MSEPVPGSWQRFRARLEKVWDSDLAYSFRSSPIAIIAGCMTALLLVLALMAPWIAPQDAFDVGAVRLEDGFLRPLERGSSGILHLAGTDSQGRDVLSAILYGARISLLVGFASVAFSMTMGVALGLAAGFLGGRVDAIIMRIADVQLSFPAILIALLVFGIARGFIHPSQHEQVAVYVLIISIGLSHWASYARTVRSSTLVERNKEYVQAARVMGRR